jgi:ectoine hydroxylase-related dioxygenase (phytanoyl-CoA dioxygenase family)
MPKTLSESEVERYRRDGFVAPIRVFSEAEARAARADLEAVEDSMGGRFRAPYNTKFYLRYPWAHAFATQPRLLDAVEDLIGPDIMLYHNTAWLKAQGAESYVSWHQDNTYFGHDPCEVLTAWIALSPATEETGCMQFLPGTHRLGQLALREPDTGGANMLSSGATADFDVSGVAAVPIVLQPGEASIHHAFLIHGSSPNRGNDRRLGITFIYHPPHLRQLGACRTSALLVRGEDRYGNFDHERPPVAGDDPATQARHEHAVSLYRAKVRELGNQTVERFDGDNAGTSTG